MNRCPLMLAAAMSAALAAPAVQAGDSPTNTIRRFMETLYSNDKAGYEQTIVPHPESGRLVGKQKLRPEELAEVREDVSRLRLMQTDPFRLHGRNTAPNAAGDYAEGTKATFMTQFRGVTLSIPVVKTADGWKVDIRFWIATTHEHEETDPEVVAQKFLFFLIGHKERELRAVTTADGVLGPLLTGSAPDEDQYYCLAMEMPVVQAREGEGMALPCGVLHAGASTRAHRWVIGMYGPHELLFELRKEKSGWKVVPHDYLSVIGIGSRPSPTYTERRDEPRMGL